MSGVVICSMCCERPGKWSSPKVETTFCFECLKAVMVGSLIQDIDLMYRLARLIGFTEIN